MCKKRMCLNSHSAFEPGEQIRMSSILTIFGRWKEWLGAGECDENKTHEGQEDSHSNSYKQKTGQTSSSICLVACQAHCGVMCSLVLLLGSVRLSLLLSCVVCKSPQSNSCCLKGFLACRKEEEK